MRLLRIVLFLTPGLPLSEKSVKSTKVSRLILKNFLYNDKLLKMAEVEWRIFGMTFNVGILLKMK